eukprot:5336988-Lingulodinium_polyedra.AAC.1
MPRRGVSPCKAGASSGGAVASAPTRSIHAPNTRVHLQHAHARAHARAQKPRTRARKHMAVAMHTMNIGIHTWQSRARPTLSFSAPDPVRAPRWRRAGQYVSKTRAASFLLLCMSTSRDGGKTYTHMHD